MYVQVAAILTSNTCEEGDFAFAILVNVSVIGGDGVEDWDLVLLIGHCWVSTDTKGGSKLVNRRLGGRRRGRGGGESESGRGGFKNWRSSKGTRYLDRFSFLRVDRKPLPKSEG